MQVDAGSTLLGAALLLWSASAALSEEIDPAARTANDAAEASPGSPKTEARSADRPKGSPLERLKARSARARWRELIDSTPRAFQRQPPPQDLRGAPAAEAAGSPLPEQSAAPAPSDIADEDPFQRLLPTPEGGNLLSQQQPAPGVPEGADTAPYSEPVRDPRKLKKLTSIMPFDDYEPDPALQKQDRCQNLCPRPQTGNCPECANKDTPPRPGSNAVPCPECPEEVSLFSGQYLGRNFPDMRTNWLAMDLWYRPLYTQDVTLERYGHTRNRFVQPFFSIAKLGVQVVGIPYQMVLSPPCSRVYPLGYYRPGDCVPYLYYQIPLNLQAAAVEAGVIAGAYYLFLPNLNP